MYFVDFRLVRERREFVSTFLQRDFQGSYFSTYGMARDLKIFNMSLGCMELGWRAFHCN